MQRGQVVSDLAPSSHISSEEPAIGSTIGMVLQLVESKNADLKLQVAACDAIAERILGYSASQLQGKCLSDLPWRSLSEEGYPGLSDIHAIASLETGQPYQSITLGFQHPSGELRQIKLGSQPLFNQSPNLTTETNSPAANTPANIKPYAVVTTLQEITGQNQPQQPPVEQRLEAEEVIRQTDGTDPKEAERLLQAQNRRLNLLYQNTRDLLSTTEPLQLVDQLFHHLQGPLALDIYFNYLADPDHQRLHLASHGGVSDVERQLVEQLDYGQGICGTAAQQQRQIVQLDVQNSANPNAYLIKTLGLTAYASQPLMSGQQLFGTLAFGSRRRTHFTSAEIELMQSLCDQIAIALERSQLMKSLQQQNDELQQANRIKDEFLAILSHELRTPLNPILGWARILQSQEFPEAQQKHGLATIERNANLQVQLIDDLLDIARILRGKLMLNFTSVALVETIQAAIETVRLAAEAKSIYIEAHLETPIGRILGDSGKLQQVVWNLLTNAIKFTPEGGRVSVRLEQVECWQESETPSHPALYAQITVSDTGRGIAPDFLPHIFEAFRQQDSSTTRKFGGLGLGLTIVRQLVEAHRGTIAVDSPGDDQGATFTVFLPLQAEVVTPIRACASPPAVGLQGLRLLIVEDEADSLEIVRVVLEKEGATVTAVNSAEAALHHLTESAFDLLITDIGMTGMDGHALLQAVRSLPLPCRTLPAIALTSYAGEAERQRALKTGFKQHLAKPIDPRQLVQAILSSLNKDSQVAIKAGSNCLRSLSGLALDQYP